MPRPSCHARAAGPTIDSGFVGCISKTARSLSAPQVTSSGLRSGRRRHRRARDGAALRGYVDHDERRVPGVCLDLENTTTGRSIRCGLYVSAIGPCCLVLSCSLVWRDIQRRDAMGFRMRTSDMYDDVCDVQHVLPLFGRRVGDRSPANNPSIRRIWLRHSHSISLPASSLPQFGHIAMAILWSSSTSWLAGAPPLVPGVRPRRLLTSLPHAQGQPSVFVASRCRKPPLAAKVPQGDMRAGYRLVILQAAKGQSLFLQAERIKGHWNKILALCLSPSWTFPFGAPVGR
ncbi:hypothetical protein EDB80DRAFT_179983 [Ilyonectria destructans]|nr:hypothetical protein EDB80DRAFT_179983 [Ilyonectria destructans]